MLGKNKGSEFERYICKELSLWITQKERDDIFWRSHSSGGRFSYRIKLGKSTYNQSGDITNIHPIGDTLLKYFTFELKFYKNVSLWHLLSDDTANKGNNIPIWWEKLKKDCSLKNKTPVLIVKRNYKPILMITNELFSDFLKKHFNLSYKVKWNNNIENAYFFLFLDLLKLDSKKFSEELQKGLK